MTDQSQTLPPETSTDTDKRISSPASEGGLMPLILPDGETDPHSPEAAPANHSATQGSKKDSTTTGTSGRYGLNSSVKTDLLLFLENRLQANLPSSGSTLYTQTWRVKVTPSGRRLSAHTASTRRTDDSDCGSPLFSTWQTPTAAAHKGAGRKENIDKRFKRRGGMNFQEQVSLTPVPWATPLAKRETRKNHEQRAEQRKAEGKTPFSMGLGEQAQKMPWPTPMTGSTSTRRSAKAKGLGLGMTMREHLDTIPGGTPSGSNAPTENDDASPQGPTPSPTPSQDGSGK